MVGHPRRAFVAVLLLVLMPYVAISTMSSGDAASHPAERCKRPAHGFVPTYAGIPAIGRAVQVIQVKRKPNGQYGAGPTTKAGKWLMSMDPKIHPGAHKGNVMLSGHTWPDGSALGNAMLEHLWTGNGIVLSNGDTRACYRVYKRVSYPANDVPQEAFSTTGPERVVIVACSGKRLGPGNWTRRTLWFATPWVPKPKSQPSNSQPSSQPTNQTLLGSLLGG